MLTPLRVKEYLQRYGTGSTAQMSRYFNTDPACIELVMKVWLKQGRVRLDSSCTTCQISCTQILTYRWVKSSCLG